MRVGIDARFYGQEGKGLGRYTERLIKHLEDIDRENNYFIFLRQKNFDLYQPRYSNFQKVLVDIHRYSFKEQIVFPFVLRKYKLDLVHFLHVNVPLIWRGKFVLTIHDLIHLKTGKQGSTHNALFYFLKKQAYKLVLSQALKGSSEIIVVSYTTKADIEQNFDLEKKKIKVIYEGVEDISLREKPVEGIKKPFLLYVGNAYPHKNLEKLINSFEFVRKKEKISLVLVGKIDYFYQRLQELVKARKIKEVIFLSQIKDEELKWLYKNSLAYVCPSLKEGFGLPGLEAMFYGCPVVSSQRSSLTEIYEQAALYFDPTDEKEMAETILKVIKNRHLRENLINKGYNQIKKYSWQKCAQQTLKVYQEVA